MPRWLKKLIRHGTFPLPTAMHDSYIAAIFIEIAMLE